MTPHPCPVRGAVVGELLQTRDGYHPHGPAASAHGDRQPHTMVVRVTGEMDQDRAQQLWTELDAALGRTRGEVIVDLSGLVFCGSSGPNALLAARLHAVEAGRVLRLACPSRRMLRLLELTGAKPLFAIDATHLPDPSPLWLVGEGVEDEEPFVVAGLDGEAGAAQCGGQGEPEGATKSGQVGFGSPVVAGSVSAGWGDVQGHPADRHAAGVCDGVHAVRSGGDLLEAERPPHPGRQHLAS